MPSVARHYNDQPLVVLTSAFSLNMIPPGFAQGQIHYRRLTEREVIEIAQQTPDMVGSVFRPEIHTILERRLNRKIDNGRRSVAFDHDTRVIVALYVGPKMRDTDTDIPPNGHMAYFELVQYDVVEDEFMRARGYWKREHEDHPITDWRAEVIAGETMMGYWEWVRAQVAGERLNELAEEGV